MSEANGLDWALIKPSYCMNFDIFFKFMHLLKYFFFCYSRNVAVYGGMQLINLFFYIFFAGVAYLFIAFITN